MSWCVAVELALGPCRRPDGVQRRRTQTVLTAAAAVRGPWAVCARSSMVYGVLDDNELPLSEDAELRAAAEATGVGDLRRSAHWLGGPPGAPASITVCGRRCSSAVPTPR
ncbi:hypothetical protein SALBM311S_06414 [Streptomyces alboniger]